MHIINLIILTFKVVQMLFTIIRKFQTEIIKFKVSKATISVFSQDDNINSLFILKSEKFSDLLMFSSDQKKLYSFITKFYLKLERNVDQFLTDTDKISYKIS